MPPPWADAPDVLLPEIVESLTSAVAGPLMKSPPPSLIDVFPITVVCSKDIALAFKARNDAPPPGAWLVLPPILVFRIEIDLPPDIKASIPPPNPCVELFSILLPSIDRLPPRR